MLTPVALAACEVGDVITVGELGPLSFDAAVLDICLEKKQNKTKNQIIKSNVIIHLVNVFLLVYNAIWF